MTIEEMGNKCLQERGYMVTARGPWLEPLSPGHIANGVGDHEFGTIDQKFRVMAVTDGDDWDAQSKLLGVDGSYPDGTHFYRLVTE